MTRNLKISLLAGIVALGAFAFNNARGADADDKGKSVTGVLIDQMCGEKQMSKDDPQASAAKHPKSCAMKESCAESGFAVISGKKMYKFDDKGNQLAKDYLAKSDSKTEVTVKGDVKDDGTIAVTDIEAAPAKG